MPSVRNVKGPDEPVPPPGRLPLRWAVILVIAIAAALPAATVAGPPGAVAVFFTVAAALHVMVA